MKLIFWYGTEVQNQNFHKMEFLYFMIKWVFILYNPSIHLYQALRHTYIGDESTNIFKKTLVMPIRVLVGSLAMKIDSINFSEEGQIWSVRDHVVSFNYQ